MVQLSHLGPDATRLARAVAVLERTEIDQAARLAGLELPDAVRAPICSSGRACSSDGILWFRRTPLLRGAVYRDMAAAERAATHGLAARLLADAHANPAHVAEHLVGHHSGR